MNKLKKNFFCCCVDNKDGENSNGKLKFHRIFLWLKVWKNLKTYGFGFVYCLRKIICKYYKFLSKLEFWGNTMGFVLFDLRLPQMSKRGRPLRLTISMMASNSLQISLKKFFEANCWLVLQNVTFGPKTCDCGHKMP